MGHQSPYRIHPVPPPPPPLPRQWGVSIDRLAGTVAAWLADDHPAWETIGAFERDVERVLRGDITRPPGMPLRAPRDPSLSEHR